MATAVNEEPDRGASDGIECGTRELRIYVLRSQSSGERSLVSMRRMRRRRTHSILLLRLGFNTQRVADKLARTTSLIHKIHGQAKYVVYQNDQVCSLNKLIPDFLLVKA